MFFFYCERVHCRKISPPEVRINKTVRAGSGKGVNVRYTLYRARICKRLCSPGIDSKESILPAYVASLAGRYVKKGCRTGLPGWESIPGLLKRFKNKGSVFIFTGSMLLLLFSHR
jgi:hypothetical protein